MSSKATRVIPVMNSAASTLRVLQVQTETQGDKNYVAHLFSTFFPQKVPVPF